MTCGEKESSRGLRNNHRGEEQVGNFNPKHKLSELNTTIFSTIIVKCNLEQNLRNGVGFCLIRLLSMIKVKV